MLSSEQFAALHHALQSEIKSSYTPMIFVCWLVIVAMPTKNGPKFVIPKSITETLLLYSGITEGSTSASPWQTKLSNP
jgi:hypothetical protein